MNTMRDKVFKRCLSGNFKKQTALKINDEKTVVTADDSHTGRCLYRNVETSLPPIPQEVTAFVPPEHLRHGEGRCNLLLSPFERTTEPCLSLQ